MRDLVALALIVVPFLVLAAFVTACDRLVGPDELAPAADDDVVDAADRVEVAA